MVGPNTKAALDGATSGMPAPIPLTSSRCPNYITEGEIAGCVTELQILLNNHGAGLAVYGDFGPMTLAAVGLDCSGFSRWIYDLAYGRDVLGAGNTNDHISEMTRVSSPVPGDLVFFGTDPSNTHHVGVYIGNGQMINAFQTGTVIQTNNISGLNDLAALEVRARRPLDLDLPALVQQPGLSRGKHLRSERAAFGARVMRRQEFSQGRPNPSSIQAGHGMPSESPHNGAARWARASATAGESEEC
jgi:hypothetical protein